MVEVINLNIVASDRMFYKGPCEELVFPGIDGFYGILPNHEPMITCLTKGELKYKVDGEWNYVAISDGFLEIMPDYITVITDTAERPDEIDTMRAEAAKERAEERLRQKQSLREYYHTQAALQKAMNRLSINNKHSHNI